MKYRIIPHRCAKRRERDNYEHGCDPDSCEMESLPCPKPSDDGILAVMSGVVGSKLKPEDVCTFDPNIYCDTKSPPGYRVVKDNIANGNYRVEHDRLENDRGRQPSKREMADFEAGRIDLWHTTYELHFRVQLVGLGEEELAEMLGIKNP